MKKQMVLVLASVAFALTPAAFCQSLDTGTTTLSATIGPEASLTTVDSTATLTGDTKFGSRTATTNFTYKIRTSETSGTGSITVQVTTFGTGGPAVSDLSYTCTDAASGTPCSSSTIASSSSGTNVVSFGASAHSVDAGDSGSVTWVLVDRPSIKTATYTSTATFTISAT